MAKQSFSTIESIFKAFNDLTVLVIGDVMIDSYLWGKVDRISPEAPVPIVNVQNREIRLGGAANVALNVQALGAKPIICSVIGNDLDGKNFIQLLKENKLSKEGIIESSDRITTIKHRIISGSHHVLRVDQEAENELNKNEFVQLVSKIESLLDKVDVIIFEDYDKGVITKALIQKVVELAQSKKIPTIVDPKKRNFLHYKGVNLFKPNRKELKEGLKLDLDLKDKHQVEKAVDALIKELGCEAVLITLSEQGIFYKGKRDKVHLPAHKREIADVSGAGDTVVSVAALCLALGLSPSVMASLSNLAGGLVCEQVGVVPIDKIKLKDEFKKLNVNFV